MSRGCNCGKPKPRPGAGAGKDNPAFTLTQNGRTQAFGSKLERDAAFVRGGRVGERRP